MNTTSKYEPEFCQKLIDHMSKGKSFESFGHVAKAGRRTLYDWVERHPEFKEAKEKAEAAALEFFESRLVAGISGQKIPNFDHKMSNSTLLIFALKTRFHKVYGEKKAEVDEDDDLEFTR
jgi:regulator of sigma D